MRNDAEKKISYEQIKEATRDLAAKGLIVDSGRKRPGRNGEMEPVWIATPAGIATAEAEITSEITFKVVEIMEQNNGSDDTREMLLLLDHYRREKGASDHVINT